MIICDWLISDWLIFYWLMTLQDAVVMEYVGENVRQANMKERDAEVSLSLTHTLSLSLSLSLSLYLSLSRCLSLPLSLSLRCITHKLTWCVSQAARGDLTYIFDPNDQHHAWCGYKSL